MHSLDIQTHPIERFVIRLLCALLGARVEVISRENAAMALLRENACRTCGRPF